MDRDRQWTLRLEGDVLVAEFPHGTVLSPADAEELLDSWRSLITDADVAAVVVVVRTSRFCSDAGRHALRTAAHVGVECGIGRWAVVAEHPKRQYLKRTIDVAGAAVEPFNDDDVALAWARSAESVA